jgi:hypothetical protein
LLRQASISQKDELEDLQVMDVFLHAYVKGRQEARRDWYKQQNPAVYAADLGRTTIGSTVLPPQETTKLSDGVYYSIRVQIKYLLS